MKDRSKLARWLSSSTRFANMGLFDDAAAGLVVSGDSGSGKSYFLNTIGRWLIEQRRGMTLIDPHGDLVDELERFCSTLPPSQRRRVIVIRYADTTRITGLNPLHVPRQGLSEIAFRAMLAGRTGHVARILLHAFGETFNGKPNMLRFFHYYLMTLAHAGLTIPDVRYFFDMKHPIYRALIKAAPDYIARLELAQLIDLKPADRDELIGSTKNRFLNFLQNPLVELALGKPDGHLDVAQAIRDGAVILISRAAASCATRTSRSSPTSGSKKSSSTCSTSRGTSGRRTSSFWTNCRRSDRPTNSSRGHWRRYESFCAPSSRRSRGRSCSRNGSAIPCSTRSSGSATCSFTSATSTRSTRAFSAT